jgi:hypothetical protein
MTPSMWQRCLMMMTMTTMEVLSNQSGEHQKAGEGQNQNQLLTAKQESEDKMMNNKTWLHFGLNARFSLLF